MNKRKPTVVRVLLALGISLGISLAANASTYYIVNGKVISQGKAEDSIRANPKLKVIKLQVTEVELNDDTGNFRKSSDVSIDDARSALK